MKRMLSSAVWVVVLGGLCFPEPVGEDGARLAAAVVVKAEKARWDSGASPAPYGQKAAVPAVASLHSLLNSKGIPIAYVVRVQPEGFVVVSTDTDLPPIVCFSLVGQFPFADSPDNALLHLVRRDMELRTRALRHLTRAEKRENNRLWQSYRTAAAGLLSELQKATQYGPLLKTHWHQNDPFNKYCPIDPASSNRARCLVGCGATAASQILFYWKYPPSLNFGPADAYISNASAHSRINIDADHKLLDFPSFEVLNAALGQIAYDGDEDEIAYLCFGVGVKQQTQYSSGASSTDSYVRYEVYKSTLGYRSARYILNQGPAFLWDIQTNIKAGRPVDLWIGSQMGNHFVVVDGFRQKKKMPYHINFGWGAQFDAWYYLPPRKVGGYRFNVINFAIVDLQPPAN